MNLILHVSALFIFLFVISASPVFGEGMNTPVAGSGQTSPGSVKASGQPFVVYNMNVDAAAGCAPFLDAPAYPISFASQGDGFELWFDVISPMVNNNNYWIKGRMDASGKPTVPFHVDCRNILASPRDPDSAHYLGNLWLTGIYKQSNGNLYGLIHSEYYGGYFPHDLAFSIPSSQGCSLGVAKGNPVNPFKCTFTAVDMAIMPKGQSSFSLIGNAPSQVVARPSFTYVPDAGHQTGYFTNTNIVKGADGYYYALTQDNLPVGGTKRCTIRTSDLSSPASWRGWKEGGFTANVPGGEDCENVSFPLFPFYLGYNVYFQQYIAVGSISVPGRTGEIAYALSSDMVHWSQAVSFGIPIYNKSADGWGTNYPSLLDPSAMQRTQDENSSSGAITGQRPWLTFVQRNKADTRLLAIPVVFSK